MKDSHWKCLHHLYHYFLKKFRNNLKTNFRRNCMKNFPSYLLSVLITFPQGTIRQDQRSKHVSEKCTDNIHQYSSHWEHFGRLHVGGLKKGSSKTNIHNHTAEGYLASPQTSVGVRLSRIHFSMRDNRTPTDVCGEAKGYWTGERNAILSIDTVAMFTVPDPDLEIRGEGRGERGGERGDGLPKIRAGEEGNGGPGPPGPLPWIRHWFIHV